MKKTRTKHSPFKAKVALAALRAVAELASTRFTQIRSTSGSNSFWRTSLGRSIPRRTSARESELLQKIGELTVERDFLSRGLGRLR